jgi:hypothetical protein
LSPVLFRDAQISFWAGEVKSDLIEVLKGHRKVVEFFPILLRSDLDTKQFLSIGNIRSEDLSDDELHLVREIIVAVRDLPHMIRQEVGGEYGDRIAGIFERDLNSICAQLQIAI